MKASNRYIILAVFSISIIFGCKESTIIEPIPDIKGDCSKIDTTFSDSIPRHLLGTLHPVKYAHESSLKGTYLLYSDFKSETVYQVNKKTDEKIIVNFKSMLPENMKFEYFNNAVFCPYDDNLFMVHLGVSMDTTYNNPNRIIGYHIFIYDAKNLTLKLVTPSIVGNFGKYFGLGTWELSSNTNQNNIFIFPIGIVNLENNEVMEPFNQNKLANVSPNGKDFVYSKSEYDQNGITLYKYRLNNIPLDFDPNYWSLIPEGIDFSQDGKFLLFTTKVVQMPPIIDDPFDPNPKPPVDTIPYAQKRFMETFIVDVEKTKAAGKMVLHNIVRYRRDLCLTGVYYHARFLTPRSFVISYRYNDTELHQLHEISIDGKILGQVTR